MLRRHCALVGVVVLAFSALRASADHVQFTIPYSSDLINEPGGTASSIGQSGGSFVTQSYAEAHDSISPRGLPDSGVIGSFHFGPYNGNNALELGTNQGVLLRGVPSSSFVLHVYAVADEGYGTLPYATLKLAINKSHAVDYEEQLVPRWLSGNSSFIGRMDTTGPGGVFVDSNQGAIADIQFLVFNNDQSVSNLGLTNEQQIGGPNFFGGAEVYIFGAEAFTPEPGTGVGLALAALLLARRRRYLGEFGA